MLISGDSLVVDVVSDYSEDVLVGQTFKRPLSNHQLLEEKKHVRESIDDVLCQDYVSTDVVDQGNFLSLSIACRG